MDKQHPVKENTLNGGKTAPAKTLFTESSIKELLAAPDVQDALRRHVTVPDSVILKKVRNPFRNEETGMTTQKVEGVSGTSLMDMVNVNFTLVDAKIDPVDSLNKTFRLAEYSLALDANMAGGRFNGYAAKGLRLLVTRMEEIKEVG